jgi:CelD/BcsL family acetyltransferase involved in cellulose biosynthesis
VAGSRWIELAELQSRSEEWRELAAASEFPSIFSDPRWVLPWWRHYGDRARPWSLALEDASGSLRGLALLALRRPRAARTLVFAGGEWNGFDTLVCAPGSEQELVDELLAALRERRGSWDLWRIGRTPIDSALFLALARGGAALRAAAHDVRLQPFVELPAAIDVFESRFGGKRRNDFRRKWRRLLDAGAVLQRIEDRVAAPAAMARLLELRRVRAEAAGQAQSHMDARFDAFLTDAVCETLPDAARLWLLELDGRLLAGKLNFLQSWREHGYIVAVSDEQLPFSPGHSLERQTIHEEIEEGRSELELGPGRSDYKYHWGATDRELARIVVASPTPRGGLTGRAAAIGLGLRDSALADYVRRRRGVVPERATAEHPAQAGPALPPAGGALVAERGEGAG